MKRYNLVDDRSTTGLLPAHMKVTLIGILVAEYVRDIETEAFIPLELSEIY